MAKTAEELRDERNGAMMIGGTVPIPEDGPLYVCQWCAENAVPAPGLCVQCQREPDAVEFKAAHDANCRCMNIQMDPDDAASLRKAVTARMVCESDGDEIIPRYEWGQP